MAIDSPPCEIDNLHYRQHQQCTCDQQGTNVFLQVRMVGGLKGVLIRFSSPCTAAPVQNSNSSLEDGRKDRVWLRFELGRAC